MWPTKCVVCLSVLTKCVVCLSVLTKCVVCLSVLTKRVVCLSVLTKCVVCISVLTKCVVCLNVLTKCVVCLNVLTKCVMCLSVLTNVSLSVISRPASMQCSIARLTKGRRNIQGTLKKHLIDAKYNVMLYCKSTTSWGDPETGRTSGFWMALMQKKLL